MNRISDFTLALLAESEAVPLETAAMAEELIEHRGRERTFGPDGARVVVLEQELREMRDVTLSDMEDRAELAEKEVQDVHLRLKASEGKRKVLEMQLAECGKQLNDARKAADTWQRAAEAAGGKKLLTKDEHMELERIVRQSRVAPAKMLQVIDRIRVDE